MAYPSLELLKVPLSREELAESILLVGDDLKEIKRRW